MRGRDNARERARVLRRLTSVTAASVLTLGALAGCSDDDGAKGDDGPSPSESSQSAEPYLPVPAGVELTEPGSDVGVGEPAVIAWQPREKVVGVLDITVSKLEETTFALSFEGWDVKAEEKKDVTPYFVHATVINRGDTNLTGSIVPLYAVDSSDTLVEPTKFTEEFKPCPGGTLPKGYSTGDTAEVCMVYLIGKGLKLAGVTFRPTQDFDAITWSGEITKLRKPEDKKGDNKNDKKGNG